MLSLKVASGAEGSGTPAAGQEAAPPDGRSLPKRAGSEGLGAQQPVGEYRGPPAFVWGWGDWERGGGKRGKKGGGRERGRRRGGEDTRDTPFGESGAEEGMGGGGRGKEAACPPSCRRRVVSPPPPPRRPLR